MKKAYTFDDVALVPQFNNIPSRTEPSLQTWLTRDFKINIPILAANMDTVIGEDLAQILIQNGSLPIFHRFCNFESQLDWVRRYGAKTFVSCGINHLDQVSDLLKEGARGVCIDVAHGHSDKMFQRIPTFGAYFRA